MTNARFLSRTALVLVFVAGAWEDILPGLDCLKPAVSESIPVSDADYGGHGFVLTQVPAEMVLITESELHLQVSQEVGQHEPAESRARLPVILRRILHVPLAA